jgi:hypothetical protein
LSSFDAEIAQVVERRTENPGVPSASLGLGTMFCFASKRKFGSEAKHSRHIFKRIPMIKIYTGTKGFLITLFFIGGVVVFLSVVCWGVAKAAELMLPVLIFFSYVLILAFIFGVLPATLVKHARPALAFYSNLISHALGVFAWMVSFFFVLKTFGFAAVFLVFLFQFLTLIALMAAVLKGSWSIAGHLAAWLCFMIRFYRQWLSSLDSRPKHKGKIIDVDAVEIKGQ